MHDRGVRASRRSIKTDKKPKPPTPPPALATTNRHYINRLAAVVVVATRPISPTHVHPPTHARRHARTHVKQKRNDEAPSQARRPPPKTQRLEGQRRRRRDDDISPWPSTTSTKRQRLQKNLAECESGSRNNPENGTTDGTILRRRPKRRCPRLPVSRPRPVAITATATIASTSTGDDADAAMTVARPLPTPTPPPPPPPPALPPPPPLFRVLPDVHLPLDCRFFAWAQRTFRGKYCVNFCAGLVVASRHCLVCHYPTDTDDDDDHHYHHHHHHQHQLTSAVHVDADGSSSRKPSVATTSGGGAVTNIATTRATPSSSNADVAASIARQMVVQPRVLSCTSSRCENVAVRERFHGSSTVPETLKMACKKVELCLLSFDSSTTFSYVEPPLSDDGDDGNTGGDGSSTSDFARRAITLTFRGVQHLRRQQVDFVCALDECCDLRVEARSPTDATLTVQLTPSSSSSSTVHDVVDGGSGGGGGGGGGGGDVLLRRRLGEMAMSALRRYALQTTR